MNIQSTQCAAEELAELEEWLQSKGLGLVEKEDKDLKPGEYAKRANEAGSESAGWTVIWHPLEG